MADNSYTVLAPYYDRLNDAADYKGWVDFAVSRFPNGTERVFDIACGTGMVTAELARRGYIVIGCDLSPDMLAEAKRKSDAERLNITYIQQDIRTLNLGFKCDAVTCAIDSINYLYGHGDLSRCFRSVREQLKVGGVFVFDATSPQKFERLYADHDFVLENEGVLCAWRTDFNDKTGIADFYLSLFAEKRDGSYIRLDERQRQRRYSARYIKKALSDAGFTVREITETDERVFFVAENGEQTSGTKSYAAPL